MLGILSRAGYRITDQKEQADIIVINTCGFIESAKTEAIEAILAAAACKKNGRCRAVIAAGCLAQRYAEEIKKELPEVDAILGISGYENILEAVEACLAGERYEYSEFTGDISYLNRPRILAGPAGSAYLKISEGCDNRCAYCAIPDIRGPFRSRKKEDVLSEARRLALAGVKELILVAQDTSRYGTDLYGKPALAELLYALNGIHGIEWIRILYLYPDEIAEELIDAMRSCEKVLPYVDLPLQHISAGILRAMHRRGGPDEIRSVLQKFRERLDGCVLRTSFIVGFRVKRKKTFPSWRLLLKKCASTGSVCFRIHRRKARRRSA